MSAKISKEQSVAINFEKEYAEIIKQAAKISKDFFTENSPIFPTEVNFKKFSLYTDFTNSVPTFNTNASFK
jgi:hypothetical protein